MNRSLTREQVRDIDRITIEEYGLPGVVLMENAGRGAAELLDSLQINGLVAICCGSGNNGGDGFVIARHLENSGYNVQVILLCDPERLHGDAAVNWRVIRQSATPVLICAEGKLSTAGRTQLETADWIVEAVLGTGTRGPMKEPAVSMIAAVNQSPARVLAVDLPAGLDCDSGRPPGVCVRADHTATFVARKAGFDVPASQEWTGVVHVIDIGVPRILLDRFV